MHAPQLLAERLALLLPDASVTVSSTTRSPVAVVDEPGYPVRSGIRFAAHDDPPDGPGPRFAYNVAGFDDIVLVVDGPGDTPALEAPDGVVPALLATGARVVVLPLHGVGA
jgi:hypothetical protein